MSWWELILILLLCLLTEGFFTGTELAVVHADKLKLRSRAKKGSKTAKLALQFQQNPGWFFSATLLGTNLALVTASVCTTYFIVENYGQAYEGWALLLSPIPLVFGEIIPKSLYQHYANRLIDKIVYPIKIFGTLLFPIVTVLTELNDFFLRKIKKQYHEAPLITREELETLIEEKAKSSPLGGGAKHHTMISKIFDLADKRVSNIMRPLVEVEALPISMDRQEAVQTLQRSKHSRFPIFQNKIINIVGVLHNIDLLTADEKKEIKDLMRPAYYVPEEMAADDLLIIMKRKQKPMAIVVDEYGGASGIVTLENVIEEIVGEIQDEYGTVNPLYFRIGKNRYLVKGRLAIHVANEKLKLDLPEGDYKTIAGFLISQMGRIPLQGEELPFGKLHFVIHQASEKAVQEVEIRIS